MPFIEKVKVMRFCLFALALPIFSAGCEKPKKIPQVQKPRPVKMLTLKRHADTIEYSFPATVLAKDRADLSFRVSGVLIDFPCYKGKTVKKGDIIGELDPQDFENEYNSAVASYREAKTNYDKIKKAFDREITAEMDLDKSKMSFEVAESRMKIAKKALEDTKLKAPFDGVIVNEYAENFQEIQAKQMVAKIANLSSFNVQFDIPEILINRLTKNAHSKSFKAWVIFPGVAPHKKFKLTVNSGVAETILEADPQTQTFRVLGVMKAPKNFTILPGMGADVIISMSNEKIIPDGSMLVPVVSVVGANLDNSFVWVVDKKTMAVSKRKVTLGSVVNTNKIVVLTGLKPGDTIVTTGANSLFDGMKVKKLTQIGGEKVEQPK